MFMYVVFFVLINRSLARSLLQICWIYLCKQKFFWQSVQEIILCLCLLLSLKVHFVLYRVTECMWTVTYYVPLHCLTLFISAALYFQVTSVLLLTVQLKIALYQKTNCKCSQIPYFVTTWVTEQWCFYAILQCELIKPVTLCLENKQSSNLFRKITTPTKATYIFDKKWHQSSY